MDNLVLTTSQAAKLLGISVRTAQLLIESGALKSWKTPGGHRRVYHAEVLSYIAQAGGRLPGVTSALAILLVSPKRRPQFDALLRSMSEFSVDVYSDVLTAAMAIGAHVPATVIVDLRDSYPERRAFLGQMASHPALGLTRFLAVADSSAAVSKEKPFQSHHILITSPKELPGAIRAMLSDSNDRQEVVASTLPYPIPANEAQRLAAVERAGLLGTAPETAFDQLTWLASHNLEMPVSLMTVLTPAHQWFKSRVGLDIAETPRSWAFCNYTIMQKNVFTVSDLARTAPFATNPAVAGSPHFRFYAGAPVFDPDGFVLGSLCVMDYVPHTLDAEQEQTLLTLAALTSDEVRLRVTSRQLRWASSSSGRQ
jgi:excisionase family DNA binding protein